MQRKAQAKEWFEKAEKLYRNAKKKDAVECYRQAVELGHVDAAYKLGECYRYGEGVKENTAEAIKYFSMAAEQGHPAACRKLGYYHIYGPPSRCEFKKDATEGIRLLRLAAEEDDNAAKYYLGYCYKYGEGVTRNYTEAVRWLRPARYSKRFGSDAEYEVGDCYENGLGVDKSRSEAKKWFKAAAEKGHAKAQERLKKLSLFGFLF